MILSITQPRDTGIVSATNVTAQFSFAQNGFGRNRLTGAWSTTITVTNSSTQTISGPLTLGLVNLTSSVTMINRNGVYNGDAYISLQAGAIAPGASITMLLTFNNPANGLSTSRRSYTPELFRHRRWS